MMGLFLLVLLTAWWPHLSEAAKVPIASATARSVSPCCSVEEALDENKKTFYRSLDENDSEWVKLVLETPSQVEKVVVVSRYDTKESLFLSGKLCTDTQ